MPRGFSVLTAANIESFHRDGFVVVKQAFARSDALEMEDRWWAELETAHGVWRAAPSSWRQIGMDLKHAKTDPIQASILTERVRGALDDLLGVDAWSPPNDWGRPLVTFPEPGDWNVPTGLWHWDSPCRPHLDALRGLFVVSFIGEVAPRGGGTLVLSGSHRLLMGQELSLTAGQRADAFARREIFNRSHPWLKALTGKAPSPAGRISVFMETEAEIDGVALRVVELTGEPGDMVFCHPLIVHCAAPNRGVRPRFMRIKPQLLTKEGRRLSATGAKRP